MSQIKYAIDATFTRAWAERVGKIILNFSVIEFETYFWLVQMSEQPERIPQFNNQRFSQRVIKINQYIEERGFEQQWKVEAHAVWEDALKLAKFRNRIAHNPLMFWWENETEQGEPDSIGVIDMKGDIDGPLLSKASIEDSINQIVALVKPLKSLLEKWCSIRDSIQS
jgi:hypothetical protein